MDILSAQLLLLEALSAFTWQHRSNLGDTRFSHNISPPKVFQIYGYSFEAVITMAFRNNPTASRSSYYTHSTKSCLKETYNQAECCWELDISSKASSEAELDNMPVSIVVTSLRPWEATSSYDTFVPHAQKYDTFGACKSPTSVQDDMGYNWTPDFKCGADVPTFDTDFVEDPYLKSIDERLEAMYAKEEDDCFSE